MLFRYIAFHLDASRITAACNRLHDVRGRLSTWLLLADDRRAPLPLDISQEMLATLLGVRRPTVTLDLHQLQRANVIRYRGGPLRILDRGELSSMACECYQLLREGLERYQGEAV
jgi:hypothetical protein